jgi:checkpoint serine/threonine-protein kinase
MDFAQIELSKENVQPLASGRNVKALAKQLKSMEEFHSTSQTVSIFEQDSKEWEAKLNQQNEDPMAIWDDYIKWAQQHATSDKLQGHIVPLLQRCTATFQKDARYKDDPRYLRVWIKYIDTVKDPSDIFAFLEANGIGQRLALFYSSWALVLELKKNMYSEAYAKIEEGIRKQAEPIEQLQFALKQVSVMIYYLPCPAHCIPD